MLLILVVPGTIKKGKHTNKQQTTHAPHYTYTHTITMEKIKPADKASISNTEAKSTEIGLLRDG